MRACTPPAGKHRVEEIASKLSGSCWWCAAVLGRSRSVITGYTSRRILEVGTRKREGGARTPPLERHTVCAEGVQKNDVDAYDLRNGACARAHIQTLAQAGRMRAPRAAGKEAGEEGKSRRNVAGRGTSSTESITRTSMSRRRYLSGRADLTAEFRCTPVGEEIGGMRSSLASTPPTLHPHNYCPPQSLKHPAARVEAHTAAAASERTSRREGEGTSGVNGGEGEIAEPTASDRIYAGRAGRGLSAIEKRRPNPYARRRWAAGGKRREDEAGASRSG
ncbi:hypothetical protein R3P38DRAFT_2810364 [Favolaschia claudopus]|uniref:Uncharacterized protein n=1 Tax=Favolaschia claudopus TaxID=2862362 RepID=A0AAV9ZB32_9AGAR